MKTIPQVTAQQAQATAYQFLSNHLSDRFCADQASLSTTGEIWQVPVILAYPVIGSIGQVGEIRVSAIKDVVVSHTSLDEMKQAGVRLYQAHRDDIESAFL